MINVFFFFAKIELKNLRLFLDTVLFNSLLCSFNKVNQSIYEPVHFIVNFLKVVIDWPFVNHQLFNVL